MQVLQEGQNMWSDEDCAHWTARVAEIYGMDATISGLDGEFDLNAAVMVNGQFTGVLKIMRADCDVSFVDMQIAALAHLAAGAADLPVPQVINRSDGAALGHIPDKDGAMRLVWMLSALPGRQLGNHRPHTPALMTQIGMALGGLTTALAGFDHPQLDREFKWHPRTPHWAFDALDAIEDKDLKSIINEYFYIFTDRCEPELSKLVARPVHCDGNDYNLLITASADGSSLGGIIDFGDMTRAPVVCDLATAAAYLVLDQTQPIEMLSAFVAGYHGGCPLSETEIGLVWPLMMTRLGVSLVNSALMKQQRPDDPYVTISEAPARAFMLQAASRTAAEIEMRLLVATGMDVTPGAAHVSAWIAANRDSFAPVMGRGLADAPKCSCAVGDSTLPADPTHICAHEAVTLVPAALNSAQMFVGHYLEPRLVYTEPAFLTGPSAVEGRRTMHLGIDVFAPAGSAVFAPLDGHVVAAVNRNAQLDYGGVLVLAHSDDRGTPFYTLFGHLDPHSIAGMANGQAVTAGQQVASLGEAAVNGGWQPHLHFQMAHCLPDIIGTTVDDWPGAGDPDDLAFAAALYPNPAELLGLAPEPYLYPVVSAETLLADRQGRFGANLKLSYRQPAQLLRGWRHYLYDEMGRTFLDAYNNVPHVGHAHPRINALIEQQIKLINTNTRYLHPAQMDFADALRQRLPDHLTHCYFLTSGSEANELALRLARAHTGRRGIIVQDHAYHGHTTGTIDISPYKFNGPGGDGAPDWVEITGIADPYRGPYGYDDANAGEAYAADIDRAIGALQARNLPLAGFIAESYPSVGGQIEPPAGYLASVYARVRAAGGLCIADEVQTGLGRLGDAFWGFETQGAVPDMVVLGKPVGNGHPIGVVITTADIAASFANGMEFFSTFGGTTLACRIGAEVLAIVDDEGLAQNAADRGQQLLGGFRELASCHTLIGDVRGRGLFLGVELVTDRTTKDPAGALASYVSNRLRDHRILIGTDGPFDNVLKIRPPLTISATDCDLLLARLDDILHEAVLLN
jgi:4-aminobutyrate aminotransferase-like enzyme/Ser/Thr protein kinase RdoA (MazF antagonist)